LEHFDRLLRAESAGAPVGGNGMVAARVENELLILAGTGSFVAMEGLSMEGVLPLGVKQRIQALNGNNPTIFFGSEFLAYLKRDSGVEIVIYLDHCNQSSAVDLDMARLLTINMGLMGDNLALNYELDHTQDELIFVLGSLIESRSNETSLHVRRVAEIVRILAMAGGKSEEDAAIWGKAAALHDIGKIGIPDAVLKKPGPLSPEERRIMQCHTTMGFDLLSGTKRRIFQLAATVALQHHERHDGTGYPGNLAGGEIDLVAGYTSVADVWDALTHDRVYRPALSWEDARNLILSERGASFAPAVVDLFLDRFEAVCGVHRMFPD
jgi:response regulator RpfG family c-di-GMP phosphodiesterase